MLKFYYRNDDNFACDVACRFVEWKLFSSIKSFSKDLIVYLSIQVFMSHRKSVHPISKNLMHLRKSMSLWICIDINVAYMQVRLRRFNLVRCNSRSSSVLGYTYVVAIPHMHLGASMSICVDVYWYRLYSFDIHFDVKFILRQFLDYLYLLSSCVFIIIVKLSNLFWFVRFYPPPLFKQRMKRKKPRKRSFKTYDLV